MFFSVTNSYWNLHFLLISIAVVVLQCKLKLIHNIAYNVMYTGNALYVEW